MIRKAVFFLCAAALFSALPQTAKADDPPTVSVLAGYDLYQLAFPFFLESNDGDLFNPEPLAFGFFDDIEVVGVPLGEFDFGAGLTDVGLADTIVQRLDDAVDVPGGSASVPIEMVALSLRSVEPIEVNTGVHEFVYVGLDPNTPSVGEYEFFFSDTPDDPSVGDMSATIDLYYNLHVGSPDGPILDSGNVLLGSDFNSVPFSHFPIGLSPFDAPDKLINGVNLFLDGASQDGDFFQFGFPLPLNNFEDGTDDRFFDLAFEHADSNEPGDSPFNPVLPDEQDGLSFVFNDAAQRGWFDPPATNAYLYETDGNSNFVSVFLPGLGLVPDADGDYLVSSIHGDAIVAAGTSYLFPSPVESFIISGIDPAVDGGDPLAFPTFLTFDSFTNTFTQTPIPEPTAFALGVVFLAVGAARRRKG